MSSICLRGFTYSFTFYQALEIRKFNSKEKKQGKKHLQSIFNVAGTFKQISSMQRLIWSNPGINDLSAPDRIVTYHTCDRQEH
jgi:hypothetical protein